MANDRHRALMFISAGVVSAGLVGAGVWYAGSPSPEPTAARDVNTSVAQTPQATVVSSHTATPTSQLASPTETTSEAVSPPRPVTPHPHDPFLPPNAVTSERTTVERPTQVYRPSNVLPFSDGTPVREPREAVVAVGESQEHTEGTLFAQPRRENRDDAARVPTESATAPGTPTPATTTPAAPLPALENIRPALPTNLPGAEPTETLSVPQVPQVPQLPQISPTSEAPAAPTTPEAQPTPTSPQGNIMEPVNLQLPSLPIPQPESTPNEVEATPTPTPTNTQPSTQPEAPAEPTEPSVTTTPPHSSGPWGSASSLLGY